MKLGELIQNKAGPLEIFWNTPTLLFQNIFQFEDTRDQLTNLNSDVILPSLAALAIHLTSLHKKRTQEINFIISKFEFYRYNLWGRRVVLSHLNT